MRILRALMGPLVLTGLMMVPSAALAQAPSLSEAPLTSSCPAPYGCQQSIYAPSGFRVQRIVEINSCTKTPQSVSHGTDIIRTCKIWVLVRKYRHHGRAHDKINLSVQTDVTERFCDGGSHRDSTGSCVLDSVIIVDPPFTPPPCEMQPRTLRGGAARPDGETTPTDPCFAGESTD